MVASTTSRKLQRVHHRRISQVCSEKHANPTTEFFRRFMRRSFKRRRQQETLKSLKPVLIIIPPRQLMVENNEGSHNSAFQSYLGDAGGMQEVGLLGFQFRACQYWVYALLGQSPLCSAPFFVRVLMQLIHGSRHPIKYLYLSVLGR